NISAAIAALGDPTRRKVFERLADGPLPVAEIAHGLPVTRPAVSQHLRVLKDAGLVFATRRGTRNLHQINAAGIDAVRQYFDQFWSRTRSAFKHAAETGSKERES